jgi:hypothetical protein
MRQKALAALLMGLSLAAVGCARKGDDRGMGAGADTTGIRDTTTTTAPAPAPTDTSRPPQ